MGSNEESTNVVDISETLDKFKDIPDEVLRELTFSMNPWQIDTDDDEYIDPDWGSPIIQAIQKNDSALMRKLLQGACWEKFQSNPQVNTSVRRQMGRIAGLGFSVGSGKYEIDEEIRKTETDPRNRLFDFWPKYVGRAAVEGELYLALTLHTDGFIEVDFVDPNSISWGGTGDSGIIFHPRKSLFPLFYNIETDGFREQIPSINIARYPSLISVAERDKDYNRKHQQAYRSRKHIYRRFGGYTTFIVCFSKGLMTRRTVSYLRTTLMWLNHYENLKKFEIDHKKSSGTYVWQFKFTDTKAFRLWLSLSDVDRKKTGVMQKMVPGCRLFLPPGMELEAASPQLPSIKDQDTDIMQMATSGLNEPEDITLGRSSSSYSSTKASRGPFSDSIADEIAYFYRFLRYDFWGSVFFLKSAIGKFPKFFRVKRAVDFDEKKEPIFKTVNVPPEELISLSPPVSEMLDYEGRAKAMLGTKHGPIAHTLGVPQSVVSDRLGFGNWEKLRLMKAEEDEKYPELMYETDGNPEQTQEKSEGEKPKQKPE